MDTDTVERFLAISIIMVVSLRFTACGQEWTAWTPTKTLGTPITVARLMEIETTTTLLAATMPPIEPRQTTSMATATSDQNSNMKCRQTIQDVYRKTFCPDKKLVLEDLFTQSFELYKAAWMASCENGPFTEVVDIAGPTTPHVGICPKIARFISIMHILWNNAGKSGFFGNLQAAICSSIRKGNRWLKFLLALKWAILFLIPT